MSIPTNPWPQTAAHWMYDEIMRHVEPDLMLEHIPLLPKKYQEETDAMKEARLQHYDECFAIFDSIYKQVGDMCTQEVHRLKAEAHNTAITQESNERKMAMKLLEQQFKNFSNI